MRFFATLLFAVICWPLAAVAADEPDEPDEQELLALILDLQAQINAIQLTPGPAGPEGPAGATGPTGPPGPAGSGGGAAAFEYVGTAGTLFFGDAGIGEMSRACNFAYPGSRMCTSREAMETVDPPIVLGATSDAWVHPVLVVGDSTLGVAGISGVATYGSVGGLSCDGWSSANGAFKGLAMGLDGGQFRCSECNIQQDVACCAPTVSP